MYIRKNRSTPTPTPPGICLRDFLTTAPRTMRQRTSRSISMNTPSHRNQNFPSERKSTRKSCRRSRKSSRKNPNRQNRRLSRWFQRRQNLRRKKWIHIFPICDRVPYLPLSRSRNRYRNNETTRPFRRFQSRRKTAGSAIITTISTTISMTISTTLTITVNMTEMRTTII